MTPNTPTEEEQVFCIALWNDALGSCHVPPETYETVAAAEAAARLRAAGKRSFLVATVHQADKPISRSAALVAVRGGAS